MRANCCQISGNRWLAGEAKSADEIRDQRESSPSSAAFALSGFSEASSILAFLAWVPENALAVEKLEKVAQSLNNYRTFVRFYFLVRY
jgi:hypothetical protein